MKLSLGFSPCPNDTFIFDALVSDRIDTRGYEFDVVLEDVQTLNEWALAGKLDITKLSFPALFQASNRYQLLQAGAALGRGVGPLLVTAFPEKAAAADISGYTVVLPGVHTTAHLLFGVVYPEATQKSFRIFSDIEDALLKGEYDLGVLIHENRFTYADRGLHLVTDLGKKWEEKMQVPIPLGAIAIKNNFPEKIREDITQLIQESLAYSWKQYPTLSTFVTNNAQEMSEDVMRQHINLYVNEFTQHLGEEGLQAIKVLQSEFKRINP